MMCALRQGIRTVVLFVLMALGVVNTKQTVSINMKVNQYPAIIYHGAKPGVPVLSIEAYGIMDDKPLDTIVLTSMGKTYFEIHQQPKQLKEWVITVKKTIDRPVGYVFQFSIYGYLDGDVRDRHIMINVTEENKYPPTFEKNQYNFIALHNGYTKGLVDIGSVHAKDLDSEVYNSVFHYHILDDAVLDYFIVDLTTGFIQQIQDIPHTTTKMEFQVTAFDGGSPQLLSSTNVIVTVTDLEPPEIFCVAVEDSVARICWKDPTKGSYVMRYELIFQMNDQNATTIPVTVNGIKDETCSVVRGNQIGRNYTFTVRVVNSTDISPESVSRKVSIRRKGLYGDCPVFSNCSVWEPCGSHGNCLVNDDLGYTCNCSQGWGGRNCTGKDVCTSSLCNNGTCHYAGDRQFVCECPDTHYGKYCQYFNHCSDNPCLNMASCNVSEDGNFTCICPDFYTGELCEMRDPCKPSPCRHGICSSVSNIQFNCSCENGYFGTYCEKEDICVLQKPCNQGDCYLTESKMENKISYICECRTGYHGENCSVLNMCEFSEAKGHSLCKNNGTCLYKGAGIYHCACIGGFWGGECQNYNPCYDVPCTTGICKNISNEAYSCICSDGHYGLLCENYNPCYDRPCLTDFSTCTNVSNTDYICHCPNERFGKNCEFIDGCKINFCENDAACINISRSGDVECMCQPGYTGKFCSYYDPCLLIPCENNGTCVNNTDTYTCSCQDGYHGNRCEYKDPCADNPCFNDGTCNIGITETSYWCMCEERFYGTHCENAHFCQLDHDCENGATCTIIEGYTIRNISLEIKLNNTIIAEVSNIYTCVCRHGYTGERCEKLSTCLSQPCGEGHCIPRGEGHICVCPDGTERINCDNAFCEADGTFYDRTGRYSWPRTMSGDTAKIICHYGPRINFSLGVHQYASRECAVTYNSDTYWKPPVTSECRESRGKDTCRTVWIQDQTAQNVQYDLNLHCLQKLQEADVTENLKTLASMTRDASALQSEEIANITNVLEEYFYFSFENVEIAEEMTSVVGNLLDANESVLMESNFKNHSSERLLWLLEEYTAKVRTDSNITLETENINIQVVQNPGNEFIYNPQLQADNITGPAGVTLKLPREALMTENSSVPRIHFLTFRSSSFFIPENDPPHQDIVLKQWVVTAVVQGRKLSNLTEPVEITIQNIADGENHTCVFWDVDNKTWSTDGVVTDQRTENYTQCHSYHLTSFAILLDPSPTHALSGRHERILTYISYIGCGISMVGLLLTIITYSMFRCLNREKSGKILLNLCASMLILNTIFIAGSEVSMTTSGEGVCKAVAILLHYFILTSLCWMLVEAINMYQALITVFTKYAGAFMLKRCVFAWGVPAIIVTITLAVNVDNYKTNTDFCFLSHGNHIAFYASLLGPACLILIINIIVFIMVARVILRPRFKGQVSNSDSINPAQIRGAFAVMTLLGITWVFGPFAINEAKVVVNYMFTILNSLQGFLIFVFRCCFNPEVRMAWILLVKTGKFKRRRGPLKSYSSDNTNSKTDSKSHGSVADTLKSNVYNSIGKPKTLINQSKASKDLNAYFDSYHRYGNGDANGRRMSHPESSNGRFRNGEVVHGKSRGITTIYTGKHNGVRRLSGFVAERDEFTRL